MSGTEFSQQLINAASLGSIYALVAIGLAIVFSILRLINFAHGEVMMLGAFSTYYWARTGLPFVIVAILGVLTTVLVGVLMERIAYPPRYALTSAASEASSDAVPPKLMWPVSMM